ncbi:MAG: YihY/virulence factor BrkB family protein, partial [Clostridia bacterium]
LAGNGNMRLVSIGVVVTIFSASKSVRSLGYAFNTAYGIKERESHVHSMVFSFLFIIAAGIVVVLVVMFVALSKTFLTRIVELHNVPNAIMNMLGIWRWVTLAVILFFILAVMYKSVPDKKLRIRDIVPGTLLSMLGFFGLTVGFSIYVNHFMSNSAMYGTKGTVVLLMLWIYIASMILVLGAELNSALEIMPHKIKKRQGEEAHKEQ